MSNDMGLDDGLLDEMLGDFLDESDEILGSLNENLLKLDEWVHSLSEGEVARCDDDLMNEMFRGAHSLKGLSGMLGLDNINHLTHKVENIFDAARNDQLPLTGGIVELIFQSVDKLSGMIECLKETDSESVDCAEVMAGIEKVLKSADAEHVQVSAAETEAKFNQMQAAVADVESELTPAATAEPALAPPILVEEVDHFADIVDETEVSSKYLAIFIDESEQALDELDEVLVGEIDKKGLETLMIQCHKVKGSAASLGLHRAAKISHYMEDLLQDLTQTGGSLTDDMIEALLRCTSALRTYVESLNSGIPNTEGFNGVYALLLASEHAATKTVEPSEDAGPSNTDETTAGDLSDARRQEIVTLAPEGGLNWIVQVVFASGTALPGLKGSLVHGRAADLGTVFYCDPPESELEDCSDLACLTLGVSTEDDEETIRSKVHLEGIERLEFEFVSPQSPEVSTEVSVPSEVAVEAVVAKPVAEVTPASPKAAPKSEKAATGEGNKKPVETLRVDIERLDHLMNLTGQLVINKARFSQIGDGLKSLTASKQASHSLANVVGIIGRLSKDLEETGEKRRQPFDLDNLRSLTRRVHMDLEHVQRGMQQFSQTRAMINDLSETVHQLDRVTEGIQKTVMDTRMVPIGPLFRRFKRVIRDITHGNGKDIQLVIRGENTELDKRMIDELGDPLIHMIRNCADHGIESPEDRVAAGKPRQGIVTLDAFHSGSSILIEVRDDGKGLDPEKIRSKAIEKGLLSAADAEKLTAHQIFQLIWEPGLSTAEKVTEVSGRGMGMDIVRTKIEDISGAVELDSKVGVGTTITIKLPLTLAILPSLLVEIEGDVIAMPVESVSEIVRVNEEDLSSVHGLETATVRGRVISVIKLSELFSWNQPPAIRVGQESEEQSLVILGTEGVELGLVVDRLLGEEDIVIKSMAENYRNVEGIAGASILGDGRVSLILDVGAVLEMSAQHEPHGELKKELIK